MSNHLCARYMVAISMTNLASTSPRKSRHKITFVEYIHMNSYITWSQSFVECLIICPIEIALKNSTVWSIF